MKILPPTATALLILFTAGCATQPHHPPQAAALCSLKDENGKVIPPTFTGTIGKTSRGHAANHVVVVQKAQAACCTNSDRIVFTFEGLRLPSYTIEYVDKPIRECGSGNTVPVAGDSWLQIRFKTAQAHTEAGQPTIANRNQHFTCPNLKQLVEVCDFEGEVEFVAGLRMPNRYRAVELYDPPRLVIDVKH